MPEKPKRRERRQVTQRTGHRPQLKARRPQPSPPVSPERVRRTVRGGIEDVVQEPHQETWPAREVMSAPERLHADTPPARIQRPRALPPSRVLELQREVRRQREVFRDLRQIGITGGITLSVFILLALLL